MAAGAIAAVLALGACREDPLSVDNLDNPDVARVYGSPRDVETIISKQFQQLWNGQQGTFAGLGTQTLVMSLESHSALANNGFGARAAIPRGPLSNSFANSTANENFRDFDHLTRNSRGVANAIAAIDRFLAASNTIGSPGRDMRAKAFAYFNLGYGHGNLALLYDSAAVITPDIPSDSVPPLSHSKVVMEVALKMLDSAITYTTGADAIPASWMSANADVTMPEFVRIIRSYKARFRAGNARTPAERTAVDWNAVIADATNGITSDFIVNANASAGWSGTWRVQLAVDPTWSQMTPMILGMADTTGAYDAWLATPLTARTPFLLRTPDQRFPSGETRAEQQAKTGSSRAGTPPGSLLYFRNRPSGEDSPAEPWGMWFYDNWRFWQLRASGGNGPVIGMALAEIEMLAAEGYIRTNRVALAVPLINKYRVRAGLQPIPPTNDVNTPVPGGNACVPRVPQPPSYTTTACGNVMEAMKWEKRLETAFTGYAQWFIDSRGWGDLVQGTPLEWPVPYQELYARLNLNLYTTEARAARGTYGF